MKKNNTPSEPSDLQKLVAEFESIKSDLLELDDSDKEERQLIEAKRKELHELSNEVQAVLAGNERSRREKLVKLANIQELLRPILYPQNICEGACDSMMDRRPCGNR